MMTMRKVISLMAIMFIMIALLPVSHAERGTGLKWYTEAKIFPEESTNCIRYGVYNPWSEDVTVILRASDEFNPIVEKQINEPVFVQAHTASTAALDSNLCFKIGDVYEEKCLIGDWFCDRKCPKDDERVQYSGQVVVEQAPQETEAGSGMGSGTTFGVAVPLKLIAGCVTAERDIMPLVYVIVIIIAVISAIIIIRRTRRGKAGRNEHTKSRFRYRYMRTAKHKKNSRK